MSKKKLSDNVTSHIEKVNQYIEGTNDENVLNALFAEITILRMKLDRFDGFIRNLKDYKKRMKSINKKDLIKNQFLDICEDYSKYDREQKEEIDRILTKILPQNNNKPWWSFITEALDNATGKKK